MAEMIDPYETERKLLAISSPCGAPPSPHCYLGFGTVRKCPNMCRGECGYKPSETTRRINELADRLARECPLRELLAAVRETEGDR